MKITAGILFYWLNEQGNTQHILHGADKEELTKIERYDKQRATQPGTLYLSPEADGMLCFCAHGKAPLSKTIIDGLKSKKQKPANEMFSALWIPGKPDAEWIYREWTHLLQLITDFLEKIASQEPIEQMMRSAEPILRRDFSLIDRDMYVIYGSSNISEKMFAKLGERYSDEIVESLIMSKDFHDVATRTKPFYYYMDLTEQWSYCINIREDDYYFARLVVNANEAEEKLPSGAEQITEILAEQITRMIIRGILKLQHNEEDPLHLLCAQIAEGNPPDAAKLREITTLRDLSSSVYQVMCLEPYKASGWETQMETTLPVAVRKLEQTWPGSCAIAAENKILWLVMHNGPIRTEERYAFYQQLLLFLRETVFRAGASTAFSDLTKIADAFDQAQAALQTGYRKDPSYWFYRFDDYRLDYMILLVQENSVGQELLPHPAIAALLQYDQKHESSLSETLRVFLEKRQNVTQAADALYVHRTTLFRRLNQIREITGIHFDDAKEMLSLQLSYYLNKNDSEKA